MALDATSIAAAVAAGAKNVQFAVTALNVPHKIVIIANYDETTKTDIVENTLYQITSPEDAGDKFGFGFQAHRLAIYSDRGGQGVETWVIPVKWAPANGPGGTAATGTLTFVGTITAAGTFYLYIAGEIVPVAMGVGDDATDMAAATVSAVTADNTLPVTAGNVAGVVTFTSKDKNEQANLIALTLNEGLGQESPEGITSATIVAMSGGVGTSDISSALDAMGTGDDSNEKFFTEVVHGMGSTSPLVIDDLSTYNGAGNDFVGCWSKTVHRPFRSLTGDTTAGSTGLTNAKALGNGRKLDRTNGQICVPGSPNHPGEIAALALGIMARVNQNRAAEHMVGQVLTGIIPGPLDDRWTRDYDDRNDALKAGISPTIIEDGAVKMQNVATFYHPDNVPVTSNGYRSQISISKLQNILYNQWLNFEREKWKGNALVSSVSKVSNATDRQKAKDRQAVIGDLVALATKYEGKAWIYTAAFTIEKLQAEPERVTIRAGTTGFDILFPIILSGEAGIFNNEIEFDTSIAILG